MTAPKWKTAWVTGASSGIGREVALLLAREGTRVAASARGEDALGRLQDDSGGRSYAYPLDVTDADATRLTVEAVEAALGPIDLAVLSAGLWKPFRHGGEWDVEAFRASIDVNYMGVVNALAALVPRMVARGRGHIAIVASVAGYQGLPKAASYAPTKAALINLAECLKTELDGTGVIVTIVNPGFVETPMTAENTFPMPFLMPVQEAGRRIVEGLKTERFEVAFPRRFVAILKTLGLLPYPAYFWLMRRAVQRR